jgi:hypothetical protein
MDIVNHLIQMTTISEQMTEFKPREYKKNFEYSMMEKQQKQMNKRRNFTVTNALPRSNIVFQQEWTNLNKFQQLNRIILYANRTMNNDEKQLVVNLYKSRKIKPDMVSYDDKAGAIITIVMPEVIQTE